MTGKVDFKAVSDKKCPDCNKLMKLNSVNKGHKCCFVCYQVRRGRGDMSVKVKICKVTGKKKHGISCKQKQKQNRVKYGYYKKS